MQTYICVLISQSAVKFVILITMVTILYFKRYFFKLKRCIHFSTQLQQKIILTVSMT